MRLLRRIPVRAVDKCVMSRLSDTFVMLSISSAAQPKRRARRSREEIAAAKAQGLISVSVDGTAYEGSAADVALLINAMRAV